MQKRIDKSTLLTKMRISYAALEDVLTSLDEAQMTIPGVNGDWSVKDVLAHIVAWHRRLLDCLQAAQRNTEPALGNDLSEADIDRLNAQFYRESKSRPLAEVLSELRISYARIVELVQNTSEADLTNSERFTWMSGQPLWHVVAGDGYAHYPEHIESIQAWLEKTGKVSQL